MSSPSKVHFLRRYNDNVLIWSLVLVAVLGIIVTVVNVRSQSRTSLLRRAETIAHALPEKDIASLTGSMQDISLPEYKRLKQKLTDIQQANSDVRFAYLAGIKSGQVFFFADSEPVESTDYSPPGQSYPEASQAFKDAFENAQAFAEGPYNDRWGLWLSALAPVTNDNGQVIAMIGIDSPASDYFWQLFLYCLIPLLLTAIPITLLLRQRKLREKEAELSILKTKFVSIASHELRSPLNGILWAIQTLLKKPANTKQEELLTDMYVSAELSLATINEILDLSIFERGKSENMHRDPIDLVSLMSEVQKTVKLAAKEKNVIVKTSSNWPKEVFAIGDPGALKRAFMNIVSNAIKYSPETSQVTIDYRHEKGQHVISIKDAGIGIPKDELSKVMGGYYRAKNTNKVDAHGTGLGLWVTKLIIEQHKGKIWIESEENVGTTVFLSLPELAAKVR